MDSAIRQMIGAYQPTSMADKKNAAKEVIQEIVLCGLSRGGFFDKAAFYGGTALRIFHGLDRFSEDLDFSLMEADADFDLSRYFEFVRKEVRSFGLDVDVEMRDKVRTSDIQSAFLKGNTREHLLFFYPEEGALPGVPADEKLKIKFEIDVNPPKGATFTRSFRLLPAPYEVNLYDESSLFAGKIHAVLCRGWKMRVKGRDLYDYLFYLSRNTPVNLEHLNARLSQTGYLNSGEVLDVGQLKQRLIQHFDRVDFEAAARDVRPFVRDNEALNAWSFDLFSQVTQALRAK